MDALGAPDTGQTQKRSPSLGGLKLNLNDLPPVKQLHPSANSENNAASAPTTPGAKTPLSRRTSVVPGSPSLYAGSPRPDPLRRASSSASQHRAPSSPKLAKKSSRTSLGGGPDEEKDRKPTPKRSISNLISGLRGAQATMERIEEPIPLTAPQVATTYFARELSAHFDSASHAETVVILHDACYGHRYSRLKATKSTLSMIVERPERIHASILGASTAYVRLGGHHANGRQAPHPDRRPDPATNPPPFQIRRSSRALDITSSFVTNVHGTEWMTELRSMCQAAPERLAAGAKELARPGGDDERRSLHEGDLYLAPESLDAFQGALGGVADAVDEVFGSTAPATRRAFVAVRPPGHHCSADFPSGFCWVNNVHVGIEYAAQTYGLTHAAILDFDLHHGDGSQAIAWQRNGGNYVKRLNAKNNSKLRLAPDIGYYSIHDINSYPCEMGDDEKVQAASLCIENAHNQSIWNVHLQTWKNEEDFWKLYEERYRILLDKARIFLQHYTAKHREEGKMQPKAAIFISAGFDASEWEGEGMQRHKVNVPTEFYARFTKEMVELAQEANSGCDGRVISVLEGGYSDRALCSGVLSHLSGLSTTSITPATNGVGSILGLSERLDKLAINGSAMGSDVSYDKTWWSNANLTALEMKVFPPPPPAPGKKVRTGPQPTYATPTESFAYKVVDPQNFARSISGTMRQGPTPVRPPTPPAPEVDWVVATQELSKLLIPVDRQTKSCTPEELAVPRLKKERQSAAAVLSTVDGNQPRQLRDRKAKGPAYPESTHSDELESVRSVSRSSRRETISVLPSSDNAVPAQRRMSRRLSAGSTLSTVNSELDLNAPPVPIIPQNTAGAPTKDTTRPAPAPNTAVQIKKTRPPTKVRKAPETSAKPVAMPPAAHKPSAAAPEHQVNGHIATAGQTQDVDALTSGMKKITLKVGTKEEHDRKQKEKLDAERRARALKAAETRRVNAAAKKAAVGKAASPQQIAPAVAPVALDSKPALPIESNPTLPTTSVGATGTVPTVAAPVASSNAVPPNIAPLIQSSLAELAPAGPLVTLANNASSVAQPVQPNAAIPTSRIPVFNPPTSIPPTATHQIDSLPTRLPPPHVMQPLTPTDPTPPAMSANHPPPVVHQSPPPAGSFKPEVFTSSPPQQPLPPSQDPPSSSPVVSHIPTATQSSPIRPTSRGNLPVWSATGHIPFGRPSSQG